MRTDKKSRFIIILCLVLLIAGLSAGVVAVANNRKAASPSLTAVPFERNYIDRINLSIDATQFVFMLDENGKYKLQFTFAAEKTEADFYAVLDDFYILGIPYTDLTISAASANGDIIAIPGAVLPGDYNGNTKPLQWTVQLQFETTEPVHYTPTLCLQYTSGTKYDLRETYQLEIPLVVKVSDLNPLPQIMQDAEIYFTLGIYSEESLQVLRDKLDEIELALRSPANFNDEQKNLWLQEIADCINRLTPM